MDDFKVDLDALEGFAGQLEQRLAALRAARRPALTIPLGGAPAWEGQALFDAYNSRANEVHELLASLQTEVETAVSKARAQVRSGPRDGRERASRTTRRTRERAGQWRRSERMTYDWHQHKGDSAQYMFHEWLGYNDEGAITAAADDWHALYVELENQMGYVVAARRRHPVVVDRAVGRGVLREDPADPDRGRPGRAERPDDGVQAPQRGRRHLVGQARDAADRRAGRLEPGRLVRRRAVGEAGRRPGPGEPAVRVDRDGDAAAPADAASSQWTTTTTAADRRSRRPVGLRGRRRAGWWRRRLPAAAAAVAAAAARTRGTACPTAAVPAARTPRAAIPTTTDGDGPRR